MKDAIDVIDLRLGKDPGLCQSRRSGVKHHEEADHRRRFTTTNTQSFTLSLQPGGILFLHYQQHQTKFGSNLWKYWTDAAAVNCRPDESSSRESLSGRAQFYFFFYFRAPWSLLKELNCPSPTSQAFSCTSSVCFSERPQEKEACWLKKKRNWGERR